MDFTLELNYPRFEKYHVIARLRCDGIQHIFRFDNDYGASVVKWTGTYGYESDLWELAIIQFDGIEYSLIDGVLSDDCIFGHLTDEEVCKMLSKIKGLIKSH